MHQKQPLAKVATASLAGAVGSAALAPAAITAKAATAAAVPKVAPHDDSSSPGAKRSATPSMQ